MNKYFSSLLILFFCFNGLSQKKWVKVENLQNFDKQKIHFGYFIGLNQYNFKIDYKQNPNYTTQVEEELGLNIGLIGDLKINEHLNLRFEPGLHTNKGALKYNDSHQLGAIGVTGTFGAVKISKESDLIIGIGTRYSDFTTSSKTAFQNKNVKFIYS